MPTLVNLDIGGDSGSGGVYTVDLVLTSPYEEPSPRLLVLRSRPDIELVTGEINVTESPDVSAFEGGRGLAPGAISGTISTTSNADTSFIEGSVAYPDITGDFTITESASTANFIGENLGLVVRGSTARIVESPDVAAFEATYYPKMVGAINANSGDDTATAQGAFYPYEGPGYLVVDGTQDIAVFIGTNIYDVSGTFAVTETADVPLFAAKTYQHYDADLLENVALGWDFVEGSADATLVEYGYALDDLDYSRDLTFTERVVASDVLAGQLKTSAALSDTASARDILTTAVYYGVTTETAIASDMLTGSSSLEVEDTGYASDTLSGVKVLDGALSDPAWATDTVATHREGVTTETALAADVLAGVALPIAVTVETALASDPLAAALVTKAPVLTDTAVASEGLDAIWFAVAEETAVATDTLNATPVAMTAALSDTALAADALAGDLLVYAELLTEIGLGSDSLASTLSLVGILSDVALAGDALYEAAQVVYVVNAETGAVSTYTFTPVVRDVMSFQGTLYLAGPDGLHALDADADEDGAIVWTLRTGFTNLGSDVLKRVQDANFQARTEGDTTFQVVSDRYGQKQEWNYRLPPLTRDSYRDGVVKVGKGIQSVYWQFAAQGVGPAEIDQLRLVVEPLSRRR